MNDPNCVFCKIVAGAIPSATVFEDEATFAFLDIGPLAKGHVLVIPKDHYVTLDAMPPDLAGAMLRHLPELCRAVKQATGCAGLNVLQNNGAIAHQVVQHVHFHIIPRASGDAFHFNWPAGKYAPGEVELAVEKIKAGLEKKS
jgi:histidine triad (HIT) family protein